MSREDHIDCDNQLNEAEDKIVQLRNELSTLKGYHSDMTELYRKSQSQLAASEGRERGHVITIRDLAMLVRRLCNGNPIQKKAMDYLERKKLLGSMLREGQVLSHTQDKEPEESGQDCSTCKYDGFQNEYCPTCGTGKMSNYRKDV